MPHSSMLLALLTGSPSLRAQIGELLQAEPGAAVQLRTLADPQALLALCRTPGAVDGVLLDGDNGASDPADVLRSLGAQEAGRALPRLVLTAQDDDARLAGLLEAGAHEVLLKQELSSRRLTRALAAARARSAQAQPGVLDAAFNLGEIQGLDATRLLHAVFEALPSVIYVFDVNERRNLYVSAHSTGFLGFSAAEVLAAGSDFLGTAMHPDDRTRLAAHVAELAAAPPAQGLEFEYRLRHKDGAWRWFQSRDVIYQRNPDGTPARLLGIANDITVYKQAADQLRLQAEALAQVGDAIVVLDNEQCVVYMNQAAATQYEINVAAALGRPLQSLYSFLWLYPGQEQEAWDSLARDGHWRGENIHVLARGKRIHVESEVSLMRDADGNQAGILAVIRDVTAKKLVEETLRNKEEWQRLALDGAQLGTWSTDIETGTTLWDSRCRQIFGVDPIVPATVERGLGIIHPDDRRRAQQAFEVAIAPGSDGVYREEKRIIWPDGSIHWVATRGRTIFSSGNGEEERRPVRLVGIVMDITERQQQQELLLRAQQRTELAEAAANAFIYEWDLESGAVARTQGIYRVLGYQPAELDGDIVAWATLIHPDDFGSVDSAGYQGINNSGGYALEYRLRHKDGHYIDVWDRAVVERDAGGSPVRVVGITSDITQLKQAQAALKDLNDTLEQRVRQRTAELERSNRELDRFAYVASHDLKSPLRAIDHLASWIAADAAAVLPPASAAHLQKLRGRVKRLETLLDDLLVYSRAGRKRHVPEEVDTNALVQNVIDLINVPPGLRIVRDGVLPTVRSERPPLETVLRNLIENAVKHHDRPDQGRVVISAQAAGDFVEFTVADDGPGIEREYHERVFEVFQTLRPRDELEGSGMGLAIVKKTVESAGGVVRLQSEPGKGATFSFTWPRTPLA